MKLKHQKFGTILSLLLLLATMIYGYKQMLNSQESGRWVDHTFNVIAKLQEIESELYRMDNAQRGFVIGEKKRFLDDYIKSKATVQKLLPQLLSLIKNNSHQLILMNQLEKVFERRVHFSDATTNLVKEKKSATAMKLIGSGEGQNITDEFTSIINKMKAVEEALLVKRLKEEKETNGNSQIIILFGTALATLVVLFGSFVAAQETKRKNVAETNLKRNLQLQKVTFEAAAFALIASDAKGRITLFNSAAEKLLGYTADEVYGKTPLLFHRQDEVKSMAEKLSLRFNETIEPGFESFAHLARKGLLETNSWTYIRKDGSEIPVNLNVSAIRDENNEILGFIGISYDITQQLTFEKTLIKAKEEALAGTRAKSEFLANMSHEIRTPMNAIMGMAELLKETELDDEQQKYVEIFQRAGDSLLNIINDILDLSKIEAGHFELDHSAFELKQVIQKTTEIMALKAHQKHLELAVDIDESMHNFFYGDANRLRQILINLLGNSIKFTKTGEIILRIKSGPTHNNNQSLHIEVTDTGIGMTPNQVSKLFQRFSQADSSITKEYGGTGLGLSITKRIVELMGGEIKVTSVLGEGTTFTLNVVLEKDDSERSPAREVDLRGLKALIVDDTKINRFILKNILEGQGAEVYEAALAEEALTIMNSHHGPKAFDMILLDCRMPGLDGFSLAEKIQNSPILKGPMLMMLTSDNRSGDLSRSRALGLKSYLIKPILKDDLLAAIDRALAPIKENLNKAKNASSAQVKNDSQELNILLVDDNEENRLVVKSFLKSLPWNIDEAKNGEEAVHSVKNKNYDIVLMDMQMPVMDGYTATKEIRSWEKEQNNNNLPIVALTAYALKEEVDRSLEAGCQGHLNKPISKAALIKAIQDFTENITVNVDRELEDLIPDYLASREKELQELKTLITENNFKKLAAIGHKLKGSAGSYGFAELSEIGGVIEDNGISETRDPIAKAITRYENYLKKVKVNIV